MKATMYLLFFTILLAFLLYKQIETTRTLKLEVGVLNATIQVYKDGLQEKQKRYQEDIQKLTKLLDKTDTIAPSWGDVSLPDDVTNILQDSHYFKPSAGLLKP